jgi:hypothetical protein
MKITKHQLKQIIKEEVSLVGPVIEGGLDKHFDAIVEEVKRRTTVTAPRALDRIISEAFSNYAWRKLR